MNGSLPLARVAYAERMRTRFFPELATVLLWEDATQAETRVVHSGA
jgi:hypothetical protein